MALNVLPVREPMLSRAEIIQPERTVFSGSGLKATPAGSTNN